MSVNHITNILEHFLGWTYADTVVGNGRSGHGGYINVVLGDSAKRFFKAIVPLYTPTSCMWEFPVLLIPAARIFSLSHFSRFGRVHWFCFWKSVRQRTMKRTLWLKKNFFFFIWVPNSNLRNLLPRCVTWWVILLLWAYFLVFKMRLIMSLGNAKPLFQGMLCGHLWTPTPSCFQVHFLPGC